MNDLYHVLSEEERLALGQRARQRCLDNFTLEQQTKQHDDLYSTLYRINKRASGLSTATS